jgi:hypothetical protein
LIRASGFSGGIAWFRKSTTGRLLAANLGVPFVELGAIFHQPDWADLPTPEFRHQVTTITA